MARFLRVNGARTAAEATILLPPPIRTPAASTGGEVHVAGSPGSFPVPSPRPSGIPQTLNPRLTGVQPTNTGVSFITPRLFTTFPKAPVNFSYVSRGELPIPALGFLRIPSRTPYRPNPLGNRVIAWPRGFNRPYVIGGAQGTGAGA